jgi:pentatricopeptide repeat protein
MLRICLLLWLVTSTNGLLSSNRLQGIHELHMEVRVLTLFQSSLDNKDEDRPVTSLVTPRPSYSRRIPNNSRRVNRSATRGKPTNNSNNPLQSLNINLDSLAKSNQPGSASRAHELLQRIEALHQEGYYAVAPDIVSLNSVLNAWALSNEPFAAEKALRLLHDNEDLEPNVISFNTVILAFAKRGAVTEAHELLQKMEIDYGLQPDTISYNSLLYGYAHANQPERAESLLKQMMRTSVKPDTISFNTVLLAWSKSNENPNKVCQRAEELLQHMELLHQAGNENVAPDVYSYTTVISALSNSKCVTAASRALALLERMEERQSPLLVPNAVTYTTVMTTLSRCGYHNAAMEAQILLDKMIHNYEAGNEDCKPDTVAFTAVISCWARGYEEEDADEKAMALLEKMKNMDGVQPNALTYTSVLKALSRSQKGTSAQRAEELLDEMECAYQNGNDALEPTSIHYNVVMDVHANSPNYDKAFQAYRLYQNMKTLGRENTKPNIITYNSILRACANTFGNQSTKEKALAIATTCFQSILKSDDIEPSSITFVFFMKAIRKLVKSSGTSSGGATKQHEMLTKCFRYCCQLGLLNDVVLQQVKFACRSQKELATLLELEVDTFSPNTISSSDLPSTWTHNADQQLANRR